MQGKNFGSRKFCWDDIKKATRETSAGKVNKRCAGDV